MKLPYKKSDFIGLFYKICENPDAMIFSFLRLCGFFWIITGWSLLCVYTDCIEAEAFVQLCADLDRVDADIATTVHGLPLGLGGWLDDVCSVHSSRSIPLDESVVLAQGLDKHECVEVTHDATTEQETVSLPLKPVDSREESGALSEEMRAKLRIPEKKVLRKCDNKHIKVDERDYHLMQCLYLSHLKNKSTSFADVRKTLFRSVSKNIFQQSILKLMYYDMDICEREGGFYCTGKLNHGPTPSEHVAVSMLKLLNERALLPFDVKFQLYQQGHRDYTPEHLEDIETALMIAGMHPYNQKVHFRGCDDLCTKLKEIWEKVKGLSKQALHAYLCEPPTDEYYLILKKKQYERVVWCLWKLREDGVIGVFEKRRSTECAEKDELNLDQQVSKKTNRKDPIMNVLRANINQAILITDFPKMAGLRSYNKQGKATALVALIPVALDERRVVYNKEESTIKLLDKDVAIGQPQEDTNLLTLVYDLIVKYETTLIKEEMAYFADRGGYWPRGFKKGGRRLFYGSVDWYKAVLVIMGYIDVAYSPKAWGASIQRQRLLWPLVAQKDIMQGLAYYKKDCENMTQDDLDTLRQVKLFQQSSEFIVFDHHWTKLQEPKRSEIGADVRDDGPPPCKMQKVV